jgi:5-methyltetrahydrofolate--homocysteine methyltransferase
LVATAPAIHCRLFEAQFNDYEPKALELFHKREELRGEAAGFLKVRAAWQFFEAQRDGNAIQRQRRST